MRLGQRRRNRQFHLHGRARLGVVDAKLAAQPAHSFIIFETKDSSGKSLRWQAELGSANLLAREGWTRTMLKAGDRITIIGPQNKNGSADLNLSHESKIILADSGKVIHNSIKAEQGQGGQGGGAAAPPAAN